MMKKSKYTDTEKTTENTVLEPEVAYGYSHELEKPAYSMYVMALRRTLRFLDVLDDAKAKNLSNKNDFINFIREGVPKKSLDKLCEVTGFSAVEMAAILHTTDRTLRRYTAAQKLNPEQSERLIELARLYARGEEVFDGLEPFKMWMNAPVRALGNRKPKEFLDTSLGIDFLMEELGRIEYGIFA